LLFPQQNHGEARPPYTSVYNAVDCRLSVGGDSKWAMKWVAQCCEKQNISQPKDDTD